MRTVTRRWWRAAVAGVLAVGGGFALVGTQPTATAQQPAPVWTRSSSPLSPAAAAATRVPPAPGTVIPAGAVLPATAQPPVPSLPSLPSAPMPPASDFKAPALPQLPAAPSSAPGLPPLPAVAPPAPPVKSVLTAQPAAPAKADSPLRQPDSGNSVKTDAPWKAPAIAPQPREVAPPPPARVADRPKPPETAVLPSERDEFPLPQPMVPAVPVASPAPPPMPMTPVVNPPAPPTNPVATTPGADPMTFKSAAAAAVLGGALVLPQTKADAPAGGGMAETQTNKDTPKTTDEKLADIQRDLRELTELLKGRRDEKGFPLPSNPGLAEQVRDLKDKVAALEKQLTDVRNDLKSTSLRPPAGGTGGTIPGVPSPMPGGATPAPAAQGTVRVVNEYPVEITMVVNNRSHRVAPNATVDIPVAVGDFSYQLLSGSTALAPTRSTIRDREVVTLRIK